MGFALSASGGNAVFLAAGEVVREKPLLDERLQNHYPGSNMKPGSHQVIMVWVVSLS